MAIGNILGTTVVGSALGGAVALTLGAFGAEEFGEVLSGQEFFFDTLSQGADLGEATQLVDTPVSIESLYNQISTLGEEGEAFNAQMYDAVTHIEQVPLEELQYQPIDDSIYNRLLPAEEIKDTLDSNMFWVGDEDSFQVFEFTKEMPTLSDYPQVQAALGDEAEVTYSAMETNVRSLRAPVQDMYEKAGAIGRSAGENVLPGLGYGAAAGASLGIWQEFVSDRNGPQHGYAL